MVSTLKDGVSLGDTSRIPHSARTRISTHVETDVTLVGVTICNITPPLPFLPLALARPRLFSISDPVFIERHGTDAKQVFSVWYGTVIWIVNRWRCLLVACEKLQVEGRDVTECRETSLPCKRERLNLFPCRRNGGRKRKKNGNRKWMGKGTRKMDILRMEGCITNNI